MDVPKCCGEKMEKLIETSRFAEMECSVCGDVVFVKKDKTEKPQLIDD